MITQLGYFYLSFEHDNKWAVRAMHVTVCADIVCEINFINDNYKRSEDGNH
jgi:hypothetical protein